MGDFQNLKNQAAVIRDEQLDKKNTALRIGKMFIDMLEQLENVLPDENVQPDTLTVEPTETSYKLKFSTIASDGSIKSREVSLPLASETKAGIMSPALLKGVKDQIADLASKTVYNTYIDITTIKDGTLITEEQQKELERIFAATVPVYLQNVGFYEKTTNGLWTKTLVLRKESATYIADVTSTIWSIVVIKTDKELNGESYNPIANAPVQQAITSLSRKVDTQLPAIEEAKNEAIESINQNEQSAISNFNAQRVTPEMLSESTKQLIEASGGGTITNLPDDEDLESVDDGTGTKVIKLRNKAYSADNFSGLGRVYLRKNMVEEKNVLTQEMINQPNTIYHIQYDYDLNGAEITVLENCVLKFEGGSLSNGILNINNQAILSPLKRIFTNISVKNATCKGYPEWFGAMGNGLTDDIIPIQKCVDFFKNIIFHGKYKITDSIVIQALTGTRNISGLSSEISQIILESEVPCKSAFLFTKATSWGGRYNYIYDLTIKANIGKCQSAFRYYIEDKNKPFFDFGFQIFRCNINCSGYAFNLHDTGWIGNSYMKDLEIVSRGIIKHTVNENLWIGAYPHSSSTLVLEDIRLSAINTNSESTYGLHGAFIHLEGAKNCVVNRVTMEGAGGKFDDDATDYGDGYTGWDNYIGGMYMQFDNCTASISNCWYETVGFPSEDYDTNKYNHIFFKNYPYLGQSVVNAYTLSGVQIPPVTTKSYNKNRDEITDEIMENGTTEDKRSGWLVSVYIDIYAPYLKFSTDPFKYFNISRNSILIIDKLKFNRSSIDDVIDLLDVHTNNIQVNEYIQFGNNLATWSTGNYLSAKNINGINQRLSFFDTIKGETTLKRRVVCFGENNQRGMLIPWSYSNHSVIDLEKYYYNNPNAGKYVNAIILYKNNNRARYSGFFRPSLSTVLNAVILSENYTTNGDVSRAVQLGCVTVNVMPDYYKSTGWINGTFINGDKLVCCYTNKGVTFTDAVCVKEGTFLPFSSYNNKDIPLLSVNETDIVVDTIDSEVLNLFNVLFDGDYLLIGGESYRIANINYATHTITLDKTLVGGEVTSFRLDHPKFIFGDLRYFSNTNITRLPLSDKAKIYVSDDLQSYYLYNKEAQGLSTIIKASGKFSEKPDGGIIEPGFQFYCTDKKTVEGSTNGIMLYYNGANWVDSLGRVVE